MSPTARTRASGARTDLGRPLVIGHRGSPRAHPENTLHGLHHALDVGADGVEFDVRLASDGVPVLAHDPDLRRTHQERVPIDSLPAARLPLPTLHTVLDGLVGPHRDKLLDIELKVPVPVDTLDTIFADIHWTGPRIITSFQADVVRRYSDAGWTTGLLVDDRRLQAGEASDLLRMSEAHLLGIRNPVFLGSVERAVHEVGAGLWLWTLNRRAHIKRAMRRRVDAIITDYPEKGMAVVLGQNGPMPEDEAGSDNPDPGPDDGEKGD